MKKLIAVLLVAVLVIAITLAGCDPVLPSENFQVIISSNPLSQGQTIEVEIIYPDYSETVEIEVVT